MNTAMTITIIIAAVIVVTFLLDVPTELRGIHRELKRLNDKEERRD